MAEKRQRLTAVLSLYWQHHGYPATQAEGITQANMLYAQLYPNRCAHDGEECARLFGSVAS